MSSAALLLLRYTPNGFALPHLLLSRSCLCRLCTRVGALGALCAAFKSHVRRLGAALVLNEEMDGEMVVSLLAMKARVDRFVAHSFAGSATFANAAKEGRSRPVVCLVYTSSLRLSASDRARLACFSSPAAFEQFINQRANKPAELVAKYIDGVMRGGARGGGGEDELETTVDAAMVLFRFIQVSAHAYRALPGAACLPSRQLKRRPCPHLALATCQGKDVFEAFYKKDLAKRLLLARSTSIDAEKAAISKLKAECGSQFTSKLEGMFKVCPHRATEFGDVGTSTILQTRQGAFYGAACRGPASSGWTLRGRSWALLF